VPSGATGRVRLAESRPSDHAECGEGGPYLERSEYVSGRLTECRGAYAACSNRKRSLGGVFWMEFKGYHHRRRGSPELAGVSFRWRRPRSQEPSRSMPCAGNRYGPVTTKWKMECAIRSKQPKEGNFLLADAKARIIRAMFAAEQNFLPAPFAAELKVLLEHHIGLRAYYPATEDFYESVRSGHLEAPLPIDAAEEFIQGVRDNTPTLFEPNVGDTLETSAKPIPQILLVDHEAPKSDSAQPVPPPDPLGEIDPEKARRFTLGSAVNALWKAVLSGDKAGKTVEGWSKVIATLGPNVVPILEWLRSVL